jgi:L-fuculose-phosphate aldolase
MYDQIKQIGRDLFLQNAVSSHGGNISVRIGDRILITRRGSMIHNLTDNDIIETSMYEEDSAMVLASTELKVHREIYKQTTAMAIVHAHPVNAIAVSLAKDEIIPIDSEGSYLLHKVPVIATEHTVGSEEAMQIVPEKLKEYKIVMMRGHGSFAIGQMLEEAYQWTSALEVSCELINIVEGTGREISEYRKGSNSYADW